MCGWRGRIKPDKAMRLTGIPSDTPLVATAITIASRYVAAAEVA
jgi:hypothetical protein